MKLRHAFIVATTLVCSASIAAAGSLVSGPQAGTKVPDVFDPIPLNITNTTRPAYAGKRNDYVEQFGADPVVLVFGNRINNALTSLLKRLDLEVGKTDAAGLRAVVVMLSDDAEVEQALVEFGRRQRITNVSLAMSTHGPKAYRLSQEADVTVVLYNRRVVKANHAFREGELDENAVGRIMADVARLARLPHTAPADDKKSMDLMVYAPTEIRWQDGPASIPSGAKLAVLEGDPTKDGPFVMRLKLPDGYRIPPHTHPKPERLTVISGELNIGMGDKFDTSKGKRMPAGSFGTWAPGMKHFVWTKGETVVQLHGTGPWTIEYVNPAEDPRKATKQ